MEFRPDDISMRHVQRLRDGYDAIVKQVQQVFIGQEAILEQLLIAILSRGHAILEGVPGLGKTLLVSTLARILELRFRRIQFTPDLMPSDITGTEVVEEDPQTGKRHFRFLRGPIFGNIILADEINRTPPKTQSALLEAMQERSVTAYGETYTLDPPFFVLATQNPIEQEGTYPLPEAQLDRFMFNVRIHYPTRQEEERIAMETTADKEVELSPVLKADDILELQKIVRKVPLSSHVVKYAVEIVRATRPDNPEAPKFVQELISWGAGPRASQYLIIGGKARALLNNRFNVAVEDIAAIAPAVLRHRLVPSFTAEAENIRVDQIVKRILDGVKEPRY